MQKIMKSTCLLSVVAALSACGGGGGGDPVQEPISLVDEDGSITVVRLNSGTLAASEVDGDWDSDDQTLSISGQSLSALDGNAINDNLTYVRQVSTGSAGESLVFSATNASDLPSGTAEYSGLASVVITDAATTSASYTLTGEGVASVDFNDESLDLTISELTGSRTISASGPQDFTSDGPVSITNLALSSSGGIEASDETATTITGIDAVTMDADATVAVAGGIAGPDGEEIAGVAAISDDDTILLTTFAGER